MSKCYVSDYGLPRAVATFGALPKNAFVGHLCYVESDDAIYRYNGEQYAVVGGNGVTATPSTVKVNVYAGKSNFPASPEVGELAYCSHATTKGLYVYNGTAWDRLSVES